jgi:hypothetical protein
MAFFMARRKAMRRSSCVAIFSATELGVELRTLDLLDVDVDLAVDELLQLVAQLVHLAPLRPMMMPGREV